MVLPDTGERVSQVGRVPGVSGSFVGADIVESHLSDGRAELRRAVLETLWRRGRSMRPCAFRLRQGWWGVCSGRCLLLVAEARRQERRKIGD